MDEADLLRSEATLCLVAVKNRSSPNIIKVSDVIVAKLLYNIIYFEDFLCPPVSQ